MAMGIVRRADLKAVDPCLDAGNEAAQGDSRRHRQEYPERQVAVQEREAFGWSIAHLLISLRLSLSRHTVVLIHASRPSADIRKPALSYGFTAKTRTLAA